MQLFNEVILEEQIYLFNVSKIIAFIIKKNNISKENNRIRTGWFKEINETVLFSKKYETKDTTPPKTANKILFLMITDLDTTTQNFFFKDFI